LGRIDDQVARMAVDAAEKELEIAQSQAESNINVDVATKTAEVTRAELEAAYAANREQINSMSKEEVRRRHFAAQRSILQIKQAELEQSLAALAVLTRTSELGAAEARLSMHEITSPLDGLVTRVHRQLGEWVNPGDPVVSIARPDRLRVEGYLNMNDYAPSEIAGRPVRVSAELARGQSAQFDGKITLVQFEIQSDNSYEIWAEVLNRQENGQWLLRPGMKVSMEIQLQNGTAGGPGAGPSGLRQSSATRGSTRPTSR
jgi:multidrug resistance efflux pump